MARPASGSTPYARRSRHAPPRDITRQLGTAFIVLFCAVIVVFLLIVIPPSHSVRSSAPVVVPESSQNVVQKAALPSGQTRILLLGSDQRPNDGGFRTDVILLVVLDTDQMTVKVVSFPRDLWVQVPSLYEMKINQVFELGGFDAMAEMFEANFGVKPDYYMLTNFSGFTQFVDNRGGVDVDIAQELTDDCDLPQAVDGDCTVEPGTLHMDGDTALWYVRSRNTSSDLDRLRREQEVLYAIFKKLANFQTVTQLSEIKAEVADNVETNLSIEKALAFLPLATRVLNSPDRIQRVAIGEDQATPTWSWNGMWILLPDPSAVQQLLQDAGIKTE